MTLRKEAPRVEWLAELFDPGQTGPFAIDGKCEIHVKTPDLANESFYSKQRGLIGFPRAVSTRFGQGYGSC